MKIFGALLTGLLAFVLAVAVIAGGPDQASSASPLALSEIPSDLLPVYIGAASGCEGLPWQVLAAIGYVESHHAQGRADPHTGDVEPPILGPALDGTNGTARITDSTTSDGWAHALGPMQFLSTTWARWGRLAPGRPANAVASAHNAWDAIYSAADYLCNGGSAITDLRTAILRYNPSDDYVDSVIAKARAYGWVTRPGPGQLAWPVQGPIASPFGPRIDPITGAAGFHPGIDIGVGQGTPIHAPADGTVTQAEYDGGCGNAITIDHGNNLQTRYCHLSVLGVTAGQHVALGQVIGEVGSTGNSTGPHLHFEVHDQGALRDPLDYLAHQ
jgi:hypothetical protein